MSTAVRGFGIFQTALSFGENALNASPAALSFSGFMNYVIPNAPNGDAVTLTIRLEGGTEDETLSLQRAGYAVTDTALLRNGIVVAAVSGIGTDEIVLDFNANSSIDESFYIIFFAVQFQTTSDTPPESPLNLVFEIAQPGVETFTDSVAITILAENDGPLAVADTATVAEDGSVAIDVLANDSDPEGDSLTLVSVGSAANGTVAVVDGIVIYTPDDDFWGTDSFTYIVSDGQGGTTEATVSVEVTPVPETVSLAFDKRGRSLDYAEDGATIESVALARKAALGDPGLPIELSASLASGGAAAVHVGATVAAGVARPREAPGHRDRISGDERLEIAIAEDAAYDTAFAALLTVERHGRNTVRVEAYDGDILVATQDFAAARSGRAELSFDPAGVIGFDRLVLSAAGGPGAGFSLRAVTLATDPDALLG